MDNSRASLSFSSNESEKCAGVKSGSATQMSHTAQCGNGWDYSASDSSVRQFSPGWIAQLIMSGRNEHVAGLFIIIIITYIHI